jgi:hypothetical protein
MALAALAAGTTFQFGGCNIADVTIPTTLAGRDLLITLVRGAILTPIDAFVTNAINNAFNNDEE